MSLVRVPLLYKLKTNKPNISQKSIEAYITSLLILYKNVVGSEPKTLSELYKLYYTKNGMQRVLKHLEPVKYSLRKSRLAAILALCENGTKNEREICDVYRQKMLKDIETHKEKEEKQEKSETQEKNWKSKEEILHVQKELEQKATPLFKKKASSITKKEYDTLLHYVIASLYTLILPRRIKDYTELVWKKDDSKNYVRDDEFVFNSYKTAKSYGEQRVDIPPTLKSILKKWENKKKAMGINSEYVLTDRDGEPFSQPIFTKLLNRIFGKGISVSMLRHIFITEDVLKDMPELDKLQEKAEELGHSVNQMFRYKLKDEKKE